MDLVCFFFFFRWGMSPDFKKLRVAALRYLVIQSCCILLPSIRLYGADVATYHTKRRVGFLGIHGDTDTSRKSGYTRCGGPRSLQCFRTLLSLCRRFQLQPRLQVTCRDYWLQISAVKIICDNNNNKKDTTTGNRHCSSAYRREVVETIAVQWK